MWDIVPRMIRFPKIQVTLAALAFGSAVVLAPASATAAPSPSAAKATGSGGNFGIGLTLIDPMGATGKYFFDANNAVQFHLAYGGVLPKGGAGHGFRLGGDWTYHIATIATVDNVFDLIPYVGVGVFGLVGRCWNGGRWNTAERGGTCGGILFRTPVVGFTFHWKPLPFDTFIEGSWSPGIGFSPGGAFAALSSGDFALGFRYYF